MTRKSAIDKAAPRYEADKSVSAINLLTLLGGPHALFIREVIRLSDMRTNHFHSDSDTRSLIMKRLDIPEVTYHRRLKWVVTKRLLIKLGRGRYKLNPQILK